MISWHAFLVYCTAYAIVIALPGPGVIAIVARALGSGFKSAVPAAVGTALGDWTYMTLSVFGLAMLAQAMGGLFLIVKLLGAGYLIYLGWRYWTQDVAELTEIVPETAGRSFTAQLLVTLGNPKAMAFFLAALPAVIDVGSVGAIGFLQLTLATAVLIPSIMLTYAALAARVRKVLASRKARIRLNKGAGVIMVGAGIGVAAT
jgi:threonine/homoserine/homoserine lactone efflux protein